MRTIKTYQQPESFNGSVANEPVRPSCEHPSFDPRSALIVDVPAEYDLSTKHQDTVDHRTPSSDVQSIELLRHPALVSIVD